MFRYQVPSAQGVQIKDSLAVFTLWCSRISGVAKVCYRGRIAICIFSMKTVEEDCGDVLGSGLLVMLKWHRRLLSDLGQGMQFTSVGVSK